MSIKYQDKMSKTIHIEFLIYMSAFSDPRPSYTDRILVSKISENLEILNYSTIDNVKLSDHRPVFVDIMVYSQVKNKETPVTNTYHFSY